MISKVDLLLGACTAAACMSAFATRYWPATVLTDWQIQLNNGVVYIVSPQFASHCTYSRGQIDVTTSAYNRALYAYALSAKARGKAMRYVVDDAATTCVVDALQEE
jgi:hypothetical protein